MSDEKKSCYDDEKYYENHKETYFIQRYMELQEKMQSCYEEYREARHLQVSVITACGALLGIITGTSIYSNKIDEVNFNIPNILRSGDSNTLLISLVNAITIKRIIFWMVSLIFCIAFLYVAKIGIENVLRYFYIRNLSVRAHTYKMDELPDVDHRGRLLTFSEYSSPILTSSPEHVGSVHTLLHFTCNYGAIGLSIVFCLISIMLHFLMIDERNISDRLVFMTICLIIVGTLILYIYLSYHADEVIQYAWDESHANHNRWKKEYDEKKDVLTGKRFYYRTAQQFRDILSYYIYPRKNTIPYSIILAIGYIFGVYLFKTEIKLGNLFLVWWIFDFSFYQARYMLNDIRGIEEDVDEYKALFPDDDIDKEYKHIRVKRKLGSLIVKEIRLRNKIRYEANMNTKKDDAKQSEEERNKNESAIYKRFIRYSKLAIVLRVAFTFLVLFATGIYKNRMPLVLFIWIALIIITAFYEVIKESEKTSGCVMACVAAIGFPLRFFVGLFAARNYWTFKDIESYDLGIIAVLSLMVFTFGSYAIYLIWYRQMIRRFEEIKNHSAYNEEFQNPSANIEEYKNHRVNIEECDLQRSKYNYIKRYLNGKNIESIRKLKCEDLWYLTGNVDSRKGKRPWNVLYCFTTAMLTVSILLNYFIDMRIEMRCQLSDIILSIGFIIINILLVVVASMKTRARSNTPLLLYVGLAICNGIIALFLNCKSYNGILFMMLCIIYSANNIMYWLMRTVSLYFIKEAKEKIIGLIHIIDIHMFGKTAHTYTCNRGL